MLLLPAFIKTRVFALIFYAVWLGLGCLIFGVNMCIWRNSTVDAPIYADIIARIRHVYTMTLYLSVLCFSKFTWIITRPAASRKVIDKHMRHNYIDAFLCIGVPLLWSPLFIATTRGRYIIIEDVGPLPVDRLSLESFFVNTVPLAPITMASIYFSILTAINVWRARRSGSHVDVTSLGSPGQAHYRTLSIILSLKYMGLVAIQSIALPFGLLWSLIPYILYRNDEQGRHWSTIFDIRDNLRQLSIIHTLRREEIEESEWFNYKGFVLAIPMNGILFFILFGLDSSVLGIHHVWLEPLGRKLSDIVSSLRTYVAMIPDIISSIQTYITRASLPFWRSPLSIDTENVTPFQLNDIPSAPNTPPVQTRMKRRLGVGPHPTTLSHPSPHPIHAKVDRLRPIPLAERFRTFRKERTPDELPDDGGPSNPPGRRKPRFEVVSHEI
ncbi:a-factor receptor [Serendipita sp. 396]|nr:a-factor receptor [Serendipita sp. 396]